LDGRQNPLRVGKIGQLRKLVVVNSNAEQTGGGVDSERFYNGLKSPLSRKEQANSTQWFDCYHCLAGKRLQKKRAVKVESSAESEGEGSEEGGRGSTSPKSASKVEGSSDGGDGESSGEDDSAGGSGEAEESDDDAALPTSTNPPPPPVLGRHAQSQTA